MDLGGRDGGGPDGGPEGGPDGGGPGGGPLGGGPEGGPDGGGPGGGPGGGQLSKTSNGTGGDVVLESIGGCGGPLNILAGGLGGAGEDSPLESREGVRGGIGGGPVGINVGRGGAADTCCIWEEAVGGEG